MNSKPKILVIMGSIREGRVGEIVTKWFMQATKDNPNAALEVVDLLDYNLPMFRDATLPSMRQGPHENPEVQKWLDKVASGDGYVIVTPEYNHSIPSVLKNALDYPNKEWNEKPVGFVGYGGAAGGSRAVEHLRSIVSELRLYDIRDQIVISFARRAFDQSGQLIDGQAQVTLANTIVDKVAELARKLR